LLSDNFSSLFDLLPIGAYRSSPSGKQLRANPALVALNGYSTEAEMLACVRDIATEWYCEATRRDQFTSQLHQQGRVVDFVSEIYRHKTRERIWVREHAHQVFDHHGRVAYFEGTVEDITREHQARLDLQASESRFRAMTELSSDWYWEFDANMRFTRLDVGRRSVSVGVSQEVLGKTRQQLSHIEMSPEQWKHYQALLDERQVFHDFEFPSRTLAGHLIWYAISGEPMFDAAGDFAGFRGIGRDVTVRKQSEELVRQMAFHDALTGLANRRLFMDRLHQALLSMQRSGQVGVLMFLDLDKFKALNDLMGHGAGDVLLQQVAQRIKGCVRGIDTVARLGGDEFTVLLENAGQNARLAMPHAKAVAEKVLQSIQMPFDLGSGQQPWPYQASVSLGVVILDDPSCSVEFWLKQADVAMYQAKTSGRNGIHFGAIG